MNGPFRNEKSGERISKFMKDELFPVTTRVKKLSINVSMYRAGFIDGFTRKDLNRFESTYKKLSVSFIKLYDKWSTPDLLYKDLGIDSDDPSQFGPAMMDYFNSQQAVMWHFNEGFRLLTYIDGILTEQSTASYNRISISLSLLAIVVSIITVIFI